MDSVVNTTPARPVDGNAPAGPRSPLLDLRADRSWRARQRLAVIDLAEGARLWRLGWVLGWLDIRLRYRGSVLGPFWLTLSTAVMIAALGFLYATLFHMDLHDYLPFLALSIVLWGYVGSVVGDACTSFLQNETMIRSVRMPFSLYAFRNVVRNLLILCHNIVVILGVYALTDTWPGMGAVAALPGVALWIIDSFFVTLLLAAFCARFRDIPPIVGSIMQIAFYITPVIWRPEQLGGHAIWLPLNPFFSLLEVVRGPLLGTPVPPILWISALATSLLLCGTSWVLFLRVRNRLAFWV